MPSKSSDGKLLLNLSKILNSTGCQPQSISAAGDPGSDPFNIQYSGSAAVDECVKAYNQAYRKSFEKEKNEYAARKAGADAYRQAIPALHGSRNIADFIACVGHGLVLGAIESNHASRLLYAAQVAHTAIPTPVWAAEPPRRVGRPRASESADSTLDFTDNPEYQAWHAKTFPSTHTQTAPETQNPPINE
jgi:hypothetical protein